ncbi:YapH-family protein [Sphingobium herbicidovorans NBRC 16415]|uniref:YapH-family protein n=1 Tax=Sphingobium herbicidovorans (strain ATCC 700291 / DSM 11019 / CCUG 56400 / KCTC 2939 / LMG 18315 / NBRC 16415 / MH) TaxID=1219045 RepID=A0A086PCS4_SPHHM|nr:autotransporter outer membrane beta-barrel domain-containing protein [Sphingobium herbicidovorans]KFG91192.1 YapH-family protein [Sphingobium herbicidovorans NBRC 16415]
MRHILACTAIAPVLAALTLADAAAETTIGSSTTTPVRTSTVANGAADDLSIGTGGSITLTSGTAVTIDSNNKVTNAGTLKISGASNATGILALPGTSGAIVNSGAITLDEDYTPTDSDDDGDNDGPFAKGTNRNGIFVQAGASHVGNIDNSGAISIEGNQSAGIRLAGPLTGNLSNSGTINVVGDNSYGIIANDISGNVTLRGSISATGANSTGAALLGDIGGALKIQGSISSTGYRSTSRPSDTSKLDADDLLQGGSAVTIAGNVAGGVIFDVPPTLDSDDSDVDNDGLTDSSEGSAAVATYGSAAAVQIGSATANTSIGAVAAETSGYGVIVKGAIAGYGIYDGVDANGLVIGGLGGNVSVTKGLLVSGTVTATSADSNATAVRLGAGSSAPTIEVSGTVRSSGSSLSGTSARALVIDAGASSQTIKISGSLSATAGSSEKGSAIALLDSSGTVTTVSNSGKISATGGKTSANTAIDLTANSSGVTLTQAAASATATAPSITGDVRLGSGNDVMTVSAGQISGAVDLGGGSNQLRLASASTLTGNVKLGGAGSALSLANTSSLTGAVDFGGSASTLTLSDSAVLTGALLNGGATAVTLNGGTLNATNSGSIALGSLTASGASVLGVTIDAAAGANTLYDVAGAATFSAGSQVKATLTSVGAAAGDYVILRAGTLNGAPALSSDALLPYMFKGTVAGDSATGEVRLSIAAKSVQELGLSGSNARAYSAIFNALDNDSAIADSFLAITNGEALTANLRQMLPDHAGGAFEAVTSGSRATARILSDPGGIYRTADGRLGFWLQQVAFGSSKSIGNTASYDISGWGASAGAEYLSGLGAFGGSFAYIHGGDSPKGTNNSVDSDQFELAAHWRGSWGPLQSFVRVSAAHIDFRGTRRFESGDVARAASGDWSGKLYSAAAGASYEMRFNRFSLRPAAGIDYYRLKEGGYDETGGGGGFNLMVEGRTSDELAANGSLSLGYDLGSLDRSEGWMRVELEGGRRQIIGGSLGSTVARFAGGQAFTLVAEDRTNGWTGRARLIGGTDSFRVGGEFSAEEQQDHVAIALRATVNFIL